MNPFKRPFLPTPNPPKLVLREGIFGPRPEDLAASLEAAKEQHGADSLEYAQELMEMGDAYLVQTQQAEALDCYACALAIYQAAGEAQGTAYALDALADVKNSLQDYSGAEADLARAIALWEPLPDHSEPHLTRRREDLESIRRVLEYLSRPGPTL